MFSNYLVSDLLCFITLLFLIDTLLLNFENWSIGGLAETGVLDFGLIEGTRSDLIVGLGLIWTGDFFLLGVAFLVILFDFWLGVCSFY